MTESIFAPRGRAATNLGSIRKDEFMRAMIANMLKSGQGKANPQTGLEAAGRVAQTLVGALLGRKMDTDREDRLSAMREAQLGAFKTGREGVIDPENPFKTTNVNIPLTEGQLRRSQDDDLESTGAGEVLRPDMNRIGIRSQNFLHEPGSAGALGYGLIRAAEEHPVLMRDVMNYEYDQLKFRQKRELEIAKINEQKKGGIGKKELEELKQTHRKDLENLKTSNRQDERKFGHKFDKKLEDHKVKGRKEIQRLGLSGKKSLQRLQAGFDIGRDNNKIIRSAFAEVGIKNAGMFMQRRLDAAKAGEREKLAGMNARFKFVLERLAAKVVNPGAKRMVAGLQDQSEATIAAFFDQLLGENSSIAFGADKAWVDIARQLGIENFGGRLGDLKVQGKKGPVLDQNIPGGGPPSGNTAEDAKPEPNPLLTEGPGLPRPEFKGGSADLIENTNRADARKFQDKVMATAIERHGDVVGKKVARFSGMGDKARVRNATIRNQSILVEKLAAADFKTGTGILTEFRTNVGTLVNFLGINLDTKGLNGDIRSKEGKLMEKAKKIIRGFGIPGQDTIGNAQALTALQNAFALQLRKPSDESGGLTGHTSDRDVKFLLAQTIGITNTLEGNRKLAEILQKFNDRTVAWGTEAKAWSKRTAFRPLASNSFDEHMERWSLGLDGSVSDMIIIQKDGRDAIDPVTRGLMLDFSGGKKMAPIYEKEKETNEIFQIRESMKRNGYTNIWTGENVPGTGGEAGNKVPRQFNLKKGRFEEVPDFDDLNP
jgi:hypothetical protein